MFIILKIATEYLSTRTLTLGTRTRLSHQVIVLDISISCVLVLEASVLYFSTHYD